MGYLDTLSRLSDNALLQSLSSVVERDRRATAELVAHLAEIDSRRLYLRKACSSMHVYCVQRWGLSDDAAAKRIQVARLARRMPLVLQYLADGRIHLTGLNLLAPHLTDANRDHLLGRAMGKSKREIENLVAAIAPQPDVSARMRKLPQRHSDLAMPQGPAQAQPVAQTTDTPCPAESEAAQCSGGEKVHEHAPAHAAFALKLQVPKVAPLSPGRYRVEFTASEELAKKIEKAKELLRHRVPDGNLEEVFDRAMTLLCEKLEKERFGRTRAPRRAGKQAKAGSRHIPNAVKRAVAERDGDRCTYVDSEGRGCTAIGFLEYDHVVPFARGGKNTVAGLRLRCRAHNGLHADECFGKGKMSRHRRASRDGPRLLGAHAVLGPSGGRHQ